MLNSGGGSGKKIKLGYNFGAGVPAVRQFPADYPLLTDYEGADKVPHTSLPVVKVPITVANGGH
ncbi:hypothetical protein SY88_16380 [Clostridiales bacterium PH28_bin88]|nr:hypothetical protein SY88_16380 [Clostridiales bacterium PH28_bin88]